MDWDVSLAPGAVETPVVRDGTVLRLVPDNRVITQVLRALVERSGMTKRAVAKSIGVGDQCLYDYLSGGRNPGLKWFVRLATACGAEVNISFPNRK